MKHREKFFEGGDAPKNVESNIWNFTRGQRDTHTKGTKKSNLGFQNLSEEWEGDAAKFLILPFQIETWKKYGNYTSVSHSSSVI